MLLLQPFRRDLFNRTYMANPIVEAFSGGLTHGRFGFPAMDDWTLGIKRRNRFFINTSFPNYQV